MLDLLIVDDQPHIIRVMKSSLIRHGFNVSTAGNGEHALASVRAHKPDIILTDIEMPLMDGMELCESLHAELGTELPHILIISGHYMQGMSTWIDQFNGKVRFYEKPVSMSKIIEILSGLQD